MYHDHRVFEQPADKATKIWRYLDLSKLVSMLHSKSLHFTRLDRFQDRFEGALTKRFIKESRSQGKSGEDFIKFARQYRTQLVANCWHQNPHESSAMWSQYLKSGEGVAIQSTIRRLIDSFDPDDRTLIIHIGTVKYIDFDEGDFASFNNTYALSLHKRRSFVHENELRAIASSSTTGNDLDFRTFPESGLSVSVAVDKLIEAIHVAPGSEEWFTVAVESVVRQFGLSVPIIQSALDDDPLW